MQQVRYILARHWLAGWFPWRLLSQYGSCSPRGTVTEGDKVEALFELRRNVQGLPAEATMEQSGSSHTPLTKRPIRSSQWREDVIVSVFNAATWMNWWRGSSSGLMKCFLLNQVRAYWGFGLRPKLEPGIPRDIINGGEDCSQKNLLWLEKLHHPQDMELWWPGHGCGNLHREEDLSVDLPLSFLDLWKFFAPTQRSSR